MASNEHRREERNHKKLDGRGQRHPRRHLARRAERLDTIDEVQRCIKTKGGPVGEPATAARRGGRLIRHRPRAPFRSVASRRCCSQRALVALAMADAMFATTLYTFDVARKLVRVLMTTNLVPRARHIRTEG